MGWQLAEFERIAACLPNAEVALHGSASEPPTLDGWSDLDLRIRTDQRVPVGPPDRRRHRLGVRGSSGRGGRNLPDGARPITPRPNVIERTVELYATWRTELEAGYAADWSGLDLLISRGLQGLRNDV